MRNSNWHSVSPQDTRHPWFGIRTRSNHEKVTANVLANKGYDHYVPVYRTRRRWSDRVIESEKPLFPGYVFCRFDPKKRLPILTTPGVISVLGFGGEPVPIADAEIEAVDKVLRSGLASRPCPYLREGQRIRVKRGALEGLEGVFVKQKSEWRLIISVTMLQRSVSVEVDGDLVTALQ